MKSLQPGRGPGMLKGVWRAKDASLRPTAWTLIVCDVTAWPVCDVVVRRLRDGGRWPTPASLSLAVTARRAVVQGGVCSGRIILPANHPFTAWSGHGASLRPCAVWIAGRGCGGVLRAPVRYGVGPGWVCRADRHSARRIRHVGRPAGIVGVNRRQEAVCV